MPLTGTGCFDPDRIDTRAELEKIAVSWGLPEIRSSAIQDTYRAYKNMKRSCFFQRLFAHYGNSEVPAWKIAYTSDVFDSYLWEGDIYFIIEVSREAIVAFLDDGFAIFKIKEWLVESYRKAVSDMRLSPGADRVRIWDYAFTRTGSPLPEDVFVLPFYSEELVPGVPVAVLAILKPG